MSSAFLLADSVLKNSIDTITNIVFNCGTVNLDFNDLKTILGDKGYGHLGIGQADENTSITDAVKQAINSPLLNTNLARAKYVMINSSGDVNLIELNNAIQYIQEIVGKDAKIMWGTVSSEDQITDNKNSVITLIATGLEDGNINNAMAGFSAKAQTAANKPVKPAYSYSGIPLQQQLTSQNVPHETEATFRPERSESQQQLSGLKNPGQVTSNVKEKGITIPTFLQRNK